MGSAPTGKTKEVERDEVATTAVLPIADRFPLPVARLVEV
jgi:hypothetical protein